MSVATDIAAGRLDLGDVGAEIRRVPLDLQALLLQVGAVDGIYVVVEDVPAGIRLSAGRCNGNESWTLAPGQLDGLQAILPPDRVEPFLLTVRVLTPDLSGYDHASTAAKCELIVCPDCESAVAVAARNPVGASTWPRPGSMQPSLQSDSTAAEDRHLSAARAEWQVEEEVRFARARAYWESTEEERWLVRESELRGQLSVELTKAESQWARREAIRVAEIEAHWAARLAVSQARLRAHGKQHRSAAQQVQEITSERTSFRRFITRLAAPIAFACMFVTIWML
jgi:hypothetical protein